MTQHLRAAAGGVRGILIASLLATTAHATVTPSVAFNSTTGVAGITTWPSPFTSTTTGATTPTPNTPGQFNSAENNYGGASLFSLAQSWTATSSGLLTSLQMEISGTAPVSFKVALYDGGTSGWADIGSGTYTPGTNVSNNLFSDVGTKSWTGYTLGGATAAVLNFSLTGADQASIISGHQYIFEISSTTNPNGMILYRNGADGLNYTGGQAFRQRSPLNGNAKRDFALAVNVAAVPEASSLLCCAVVAVIGGVLRHRKSAEDRASSRTS